MYIITNNDVSISKTLKPKTRASYSMLNIGNFSHSFVSKHIHEGN